MVQSLPPIEDAIGDYSVQFALHLKPFFNVGLYTGKGFVPDQVGNLPIHQVFDLQATHRTRFMELLEVLVATNSQVVLLQYNPFAWGRRGWAPDLPKLITKLKARRPDLLISVMFHETYMMFPGLRYRIMGLYQRKQFLRLLSVADVSFFSTTNWANQYRVHSKSGQVFELPVGSNLPLSPLNPTTAKQSLDIPSSDFVCSVFGGGHVSRMFDHIDLAVSAIADSLIGCCDTHLVYVGDSRREWKCGSARVHQLGRLPRSRAADVIGGTDLMINPFLDGISTRRGSAMAALALGVPILTTKGHNTEDLWTDRTLQFLRLVDVDLLQTWKDEAVNFAEQVFRSNGAMRSQVLEFYREHFDWDVITKSFSDKVISCLSSR